MILKQNIKQELLQNESFTVRPVFVVVPSFDLVLKYLSAELIMCSDINQSSVFKA